MTGMRMDHCKSVMSPGQKKENKGVKSLSIFVRNKAESIVQYMNQYQIVIIPGVCDLRSPWKT